MDKKQARLRRSRKTRARIAELKMVRLTVHRTNTHIYAQIIDETGSRVLASASSLETELRRKGKFTWQEKKGTFVCPACGRSALKKDDKMPLLRYIHRIKSIL